LLRLLGRRRTRKELPDEIRQLILAKGSENNYALKTGQWSYLRQLEMALRNFIDSEHGEIRCQNLCAKLRHHDLRRFIQRAFNQQEPYGAVKEFRDLLCLFATGGELDWDGAITAYCKEHTNLLDGNHVLKETEGNSDKAK
jgi:hypothetical protein